MPGSRMPRSSSRPTAADLGGAVRLRDHGTGLGAGRGRHVPPHDHADPRNPARIFIAISAAGAFRTDDGGRRGRRSTGAALRGDPGSGRRSRPLRPPHRDASPRGRTSCSCRSTGTSCAATTPASWREVSGNLPSDFGFPIDVHAHEPETIYVVPIKSDSEHYPPDGKLRVYRSRTGGNEWEALTKGCRRRLLRQRPARRDGRRHARLVRHVLRHDRRPGLRLGRCRRHLGADRPRPAGRAVGRGADAAMIRVVLPAHLRTLARVERRSLDGLDGQVTQRAVLDALEARYPDAARDDPRSGHAQRRPFVRFFACQEDCPTTRRTRRCPRRSRGQRAVPRHRRDGRRLVRRRQVDWLAGVRLRCRSTTRCAARLATSRADRRVTAGQPGLSRSV